VGSGQFGLEDLGRFPSFQKRRTNWMGRRRVGGMAGRSGGPNGWAPKRWGNNSFQRGRPLKPQGRRLGLPLKTFRRRVNWGEPFWQNL